MFGNIQLWLSRMYLYVIAGSLGLNLLLGIGGYIQGLRMHSAKVELRAEKSAHKRDNENYKTAQELAEANAKAAKADQERKWNDYKKDADGEYADLRKRFDTAIMRYKTTLGAARKPDLPEGDSEDRTDPSNGSSKDTVILVPLSDLDICAENTAKAKIAHDWVKKLSTVE